MRCAAVGGGARVRRRGRAGGLARALARLAGRPATRRRRCAAGRAPQLPDLTRVRSAVARSGQVCANRACRAGPPPGAFAKPRRSHGWEREMAGHGRANADAARRRGAPLRGTAEMPGRQVDLAPGADPRRAGGRRDADHRAARGPGRARHRQGDARLRRRGRADRARAPGGSRASASAASASRRT